MTTVRQSEARVMLYPYQKRWITDETRFKLMVKGRQTGLSFGTSFRHVRKRVKTRGTTVWVSASQRQSKEAIEYVQLHSSAVKQIFDFEEVTFPGTDDKAEMVTFKHNGARIIGLPANPDTMRGFSGDVVLDEFAFHRDAKKIWKAALAIASRGFSVEVISRPMHKQANTGTSATIAAFRPRADQSALTGLKASGLCIGWTSTRP
jgi:phage FluMu gp28-like protein